MSIAFLTDHKPLKWLRSQKLEEILGHWALALDLQEYSFTVVYHKGSQNTNAHALSRWRDPSMNILPAAVTRANVQLSVPLIWEAQRQDQVIKLVVRTLQKSDLTITIDWGAPIKKILSIVVTVCPKRWHCVEMLCTWANRWQSNSASSASSSSERCTSQVS